MLYPLWSRLKDLGFDGSIFYAVDLDNELSSTGIVAPEHKVPVPLAYTNATPSASQRVFITVRLSKNN